MEKESWQKIKTKITNKKSYLTYIVFFIDILMFYISWNMSFKSMLSVFVGQLFLILGLLHFYLIMHEATHSAISSKKFINDLIGHICGWVVIMPYLPRQQSHLLHHTWTGHPVRDPANKRMIEKFSVMTKVQADKLEFIWKNWIPAIVLNDRVGLWKAPFLQSASKGLSSKLKKEIVFNYIYAVAYLILILTLLINNHFLHFINWFVPAFFLLALMEELVNLPHHAETPLLSASDKALPYWNQGLVTHSCKSVPIWSKYILLHFNLHTAHHFFPNAAWYTLPEIHKEIELISPEDLSDRKFTDEFHWSFVNRKRSLLTIMGHYFNKIEN